MTIFSTALLSKIKKTISNSWQLCCVGWPMILHLFDLNLYFLWSTVQGNAWHHPDANLNTAVFGRRGVQPNITINYSIKQSCGETFPCQIGCWIFKSMIFVSFHWMIVREISAHADGGPRSRVCARLTLRSAPRETSSIFSAHMSWGGVKIFESFPDKLTRKIRRF